MISRTAWISMGLLLCMLLVALRPRLASRVDALRPVRAMGRTMDACVSRWYWVLFALALLCGLGLRLWRFPELPRGLNQDGAMAGAETLSLLRCGTDQYLTPWPVHFEAWQYGQMSVLYSYFTVPFAALFGMSRLTLRMSMLTISLAALPVLWDFARRMLGKRYALVVLWLAAICPWHILQSRWALEASMMPHMVLFSIYFLYLGIRRKPFLYLSMVFFGLTMYSYGIMLYTVPGLLGLCAVYLLRHKRLKFREVLICAVLFLAVAFPFLMTMAINTFGWETMRLGPLSLKRFHGSVRSADIVLFSQQPYEQTVSNLFFFSIATFLQSAGDGFLAVRGVRTLYTFSVPLLFAGTLLLWYRRRRAILSGFQERDEGSQSEGRKEGQPKGRPSPEDTESTGAKPDARSVTGRNEGLSIDGASLTLLWLGAMIVCGLLTNESNINRAAGAYYPLLLCLGYAIHFICKRVKGFGPVIAVIYAVGVLSFCQGYFGDADYINRVGQHFHNGLYTSLEQVYELPAERYYISTNGMVGNVQLGVEAEVMVAHQIDASQKYGLEPVTDAHGEHVGIYSERYIYTDFKDFVPDPTEQAAYVLFAKDKALFDAEAFIIWEYDQYAVAYPRYWAEEE